MTAHCCVCGSEFTLRPRSRPAKTCSRACTNTMVWRQGRAAGGPKAAPRPVRECVQCGREFTGSGHFSRASRQKYCSRTCTGRAKGRSAIYVGPDGRARVNLRDGSKQWYARCVMEGHLGRHLRAGEIVHHVNGNCSDDRIENLQLTTRREHPSFHTREIREGIQTSARSKMSAPQRAEALALVAAGWGRADVAAAYGVTAGAIYYHEKQIWAGRAWVA